MDGEQNKRTSEPREREETGFGHKHEGAVGVPEPERVDVPAQHRQHHADHAPHHPRHALQPRHRNRAGKRQRHREAQLPGGLVLLRFHRA